MFRMGFLFLLNFKIFILNAKSVEIWIKRSIIDNMNIIIIYT
jgi:hypothetical protein